MSDAAQRHLIDGKTRSIKELFSGTHYGIDFYQRDYAWQTKHLEELLQDLTRSFDNQFETSHTRKQVANYRPYFLGPIVTHATTERTNLVDGQQRLTTLSLILLRLSKITTDSRQKAALETLVFDSSFGDSNFVIDVDERNPVLEQILKDEPIETSDLPASVRNIVDRYMEIVEYFDDDHFTASSLIYFIDWMLHRVQLVEIQTFDRDMALEVFESMNDRGLQLTNMDMLKTYLLSKMTTASQTEIASKVWKANLAELSFLDTNADSEFMKTLLRSRYATTIRETNKGSVAMDYETIGTSFHKWFRDNASSFGLENADDFEHFITNVMPYYSRRYRKLIEVSEKFDPEWSYVYFNAYNNFTLQYLVILGATSPLDSDEVFHEKAILIAKYLDLVIARRMVNYKIFGYSPMYRPMFNLAKELRDESLSGIQQILAARVANLTEKFSAVQGFRLHQGNRPSVRYLLGRITAWLEGQALTETGAETPPWAIYFVRNLVEPFETEHIWANHFERHFDEFTSEQEFQDSRNSFGALLLLPKSVNASLSDSTVQQKIAHYLQHNALARITSPLGPEKDPKLRSLLQGLSLETPYVVDELDPDSIKVRTRFYQELCENIWDPVSLGLAFNQK